MNYKSIIQSINQNPVWCYTHRGKTGLPQQTYQCNFTEVIAQAKLALKQRQLNHSSRQGTLFVAKAIFHDNFAGYFYRNFFGYCLVTEER